MPRVSRRTVLGAGLALAAGRRAILRAQDGLLRAYVGTFTAPLGAQVPAYFGGTGPGPHSRGIYTFTFDPETGRAGEPTLAAEVSNPFNLTMDSDRRRVYTCRWPTEVDGQNLISAFAADGDNLRELNTVRSGGGGPTVGVVDRTGRNLLTTNFITPASGWTRQIAKGGVGYRPAGSARDPAGGGLGPG
ncbi:MAG: lactonase family protein, partial [Acidobacteria bacterium]|nr:lactonase family protein [Acidobacteriota bacterium]